MILIASQKWDTMLLPSSRFQSFVHTPGTPSRMRIPNRRVICWIYIYIYVYIYIYPILSVTSQGFHNEIPIFLIVLCESNHGCSRLEVALRANQEAVSGRQFLASLDLMECGINKHIVTTMLKKSQIVLQCVFVPALCLCTLFVFSSKTT